MFETLGLRSRPAFMPYAGGGETSRSFPDTPFATSSPYPSAAAAAGAAASMQQQEGGGCCGGPAKAQKSSGGCC